MSIAFALIFVNCTNAEEAAAAPSGSGDSEPEVPVLPETVKILAIGNSFSADAVEQELYLSLIHISRIRAMRSATC